jgi:hypothetical protein
MITAAKKLLHRRSPEFLAAAVAARQAQTQGIQNARSAFCVAQKSDRQHNYN